MPDIAWRDLSDSGSTDFKCFLLLLKSYMSAIGRVDTATRYVYPSPTDEFTLIVKTVE